MFKTIEDEVMRVINKIKENPEYWSNNKRKMHGYPLRRKPSKIKRETYLYKKHEKTFFDDIEFIIDKTLPIYIENSFNNFVDIKDFNFGDKI